MLDKYDDDEAWAGQSIHPSFRHIITMSSSAVSAEGQQYAVQLFVYDLSNGLARSLSQQLTGRQFDAIYHTSIVVHGREWYFGQGIFNEQPGRTHFGTPIERIDLGTTSIGQNTFQEILNDLRDRYTTQAYHLLHFNCNTFTNEVANILVGRDIPDRITSLPADFLATPLGRLMGPQIESMFRGPAAAASAGPANPALGSTPASAMGILNNVTHSALTNGHVNKTQQGAIRHIQSPAQFEELKRMAPCAVVMFTSQTCAPCVQLHPVYESLAERYADPSSHKHRPIVFGQVESSASSTQLMTQQKISATPTFQFFVNGTRASEMKGANPSSLQDAVEELLWRVHRPHPHSKMPNPASLVPAKAIQHRTIPNLMTAEQKLNEITTQHKAASFSEKADLQEGRSVLTKTLMPWIREGLAAGKQKRMAEADAIRWIKGARKCVEILSVKDLFPIVDLVRIAILDEQQAGLLAQSEGATILNEIFAKAKGNMDMTNKATLMTTYRLIGNALACKPDPLTTRVAQSSDVVALLVYGVLCEDAGMRTATINAAFNWARVQSAGHSPFVAAPEVEDVAQTTQGSDEEVELLCAVLECIEKEGDMERLHRATAALVVLLYCAPSWHTTLQPLLEVTEAPSKLHHKAQQMLDDRSDKADEVRKLLDLAQRLSKAA